MCQEQMVWGTLGIFLLFPHGSEKQKNNRGKKENHMQVSGQNVGKHTLYDCGTLSVLKQANLFHS